MQKNINWGNLDPNVYEKELETILSKSESKMKKFLKDIDLNTVILNFSLNFFKSERTYKCSFKVNAPNLEFHTTQKGYRLEETINNCISAFIRNIKEEKAKKIQQSRKKTLPSELVMENE